VNENKMLFKILFVTFSVTVLGTDVQFVSYKNRAKTLTLNCNATSTQSVTWLKDSKVITPNEEYVLNDNGDLTIKTLTFDNAGNYTCTDSQGQKIALVTLTSLPQVTIEPKKSATVVSGDSVKISCSAAGSPVPEVTWKNEDGIDLGNLTTVEDIDHGVKVTLSIAEVKEQHAGLFTCTAKVPEQEEPVSAEVRLRVKDKLAALWPFLGICAEVAILCIIIFLYEHRRMKQAKQEMESDDKNNTKKVGGDGSPSEVRQRK